MSRIAVAAALLLLLALVGNFHANEAAPSVFQVTRLHLRKCGCKVFPGGKIKCRSPVFTQAHIRKEDLIKCFCMEKNQHKFPEFRAACKSRGPGYPFSLV